MFKWFKRVFNINPKDLLDFTSDDIDPYKDCMVHRYKSCSHVGSRLCFPKTCNDRISYHHILFHQSQSNKKD